MHSSFVVTPSDYGQAVNRQEEKERNGQRRETGCLIKMVNALKQCHIGYP